MFPGLALINPLTTLECNAAQLHWLDSLASAIAERYPLCVEGAWRGPVIKYSLIGMSGTGKSHWTRKLLGAGFRAICVDDCIEKKLNA